MNGKGQLIVFETIYGGGNSVIGMINRLLRDFDAQKEQLVICHSEDAIRADYMGADRIPKHGFPISPISKVFREVASRAQLSQSVIEPALEQGKLVICKNFTLSSLVGFRMNFPAIEDHLIESEKVARGALEPDMTIFIDWSAEASYKYMLDNDINPPHLISYYRIMRNLFLEHLAKMPNQKRWIVEPQANNEATWEVIRPFFSNLLAL